MGERQLRGSPASPGVATGPAWRRADAIRNGRKIPAQDRAREVELAKEALAAAAEAVHAVAAGLRAEEAEIIETGALIALDPALQRAVAEAIERDGLPAAPAILRAADEQAAKIAALGDATLAARADDVRSLGRRAARLSTDPDAGAPPGPDVILVAHDLGPADVAELAPDLAGVALVAGGATAHAAIVARSLGIPMVTGLEPELLEIDDGIPVALDGGTGSVTIEPPQELAEAAAERMRARRLKAQLAESGRDQPAITADGRRITVLANVATVAELEVALRAGAEGIGLLRTELAFLDATDWPTEQDYTEALEPILAGLGPRRAVVRVLDFGADKSPPFLRADGDRGVELLLGHPDAFASQLRAIALAASGRDVQILLPMVGAPSQVAAVRLALERLAAQLGVAPVPALGAMIETPVAAERSPAIAQHSDFLSIGTNDLTASTLGADRFAANEARAHDPRVLRLISRSVESARQAGIPIEVCGEAASDPLMLPLLIGLGVEEVSVGAAQVAAVRDWVRRLDAGQATGLARAALAMQTAQDVERALRDHQLLEIEQLAVQKR